MTNPLAARREQAVAAAMARIRAIVGPGEAAAPPDLARVEACLRDLAAQPDLFPDADFPSLAEGDGDAVCLLSQEPDGRLALYLSGGEVGYGTPPHSHGTWAVIAGMRGEEHNRLYRRLGDGSLVLERERTVGPGDSIALPVDAIHSIHIRRPPPIRHLHLYGLGFEHQTGRESFDLQTGQVTAGPAELVIHRGDTA